jgi:hypothetical protein
MERAREAREAQKVSFSDLAREALEANWGEIDELLPAKVERNSPLPAMTRRRRIDGDLVQMQLMLNDAERAVFDGLEEKYDVTSRSDLVTRILARHLGLDPNGSVPKS